MFHLALPIVDLEETTKFYVDVLNASIGRSSSFWADFNFFDNQLTLHEFEKFEKEVPKMGSEGNPIKHFGVVLKFEDWEKEKNRFISMNVSFLTEPKIVFEGEVGEQHSFFIEDPNGYAIEYKGFRDLKKVFKSA